ncbi:C2 family cysteine protease [Microbacterium sp. NPDC057650]|uniref:C2 family cysteine protease n=1 Tax=unclassified Microbacterium TaxID=2609290 RepID=UPI00366C4E66
MTERVDGGTAGEAWTVGEQIRTMVGEPDVVHRNGQSMADYGHRMSEIGAQLTLIRDSDISQWKITGKATDRLRASIGDAADRIAVAAALYLPIGQAFGSYGSKTSYHQEELNGLAVTCKDLWEKYRSAVDAYNSAAVPVEGADDYDEQKKDHQKLEDAAWDARDEWDAASSKWGGSFSVWQGVYQRTLETISDPDLDKIRKGEKLPGEPALDLYPHGEPDIRDIEQRGAGDCYLLSALAGIANGDPQKIKDMITENPDGTYTVHFADGDITVGGDQIPDDDRAAWVRVIEGAYEIHEGGFEEFTNGGWARDVMEDVYGDEADVKDHDPGRWDWLTGGNDVSDSFDDMHDALADGRPVVASAQNGQLGFEGGGHAMTVLRAYEENGQQMVVIRNPWGRNTNHEDAIRAAGGELTTPPDGTFVMSMDEFTKSFNVVEVAN